MMKMVKCEDCKYLTCESWLGQLVDFCEKLSEKEGRQVYLDETYIKEERECPDFER